MSCKFDVYNNYNINLVKQSEFVVIVRIVKMTFKLEEVNVFLKKLNERKAGIRNFDGCLHLEILQGVTKRNVVFSYSYWKDEAALDKYRHSDFFKETWRFTKARFSEKPEAWTTKLLDKL